MAKSIKSTSTARPVKYVGPRYTNGLRPYGFDHDIQPADFDEKARLNFIKQYPQYSEWWAPYLPVIAGYEVPVEMPIAIDDPQPEEAA